MPHAPYDTQENRFSIGNQTYLQLMRQALSLFFALCTSYMIPFVTRYPAFRIVERLRKHDDNGSRNGILYCRKRELASYLSIMGRLTTVLVTPILAGEHTQCSCPAAQPPPVVALVSW